MKSLLFVYFFTVVLAVSYVGGLSSNELLVETKVGLIQGASAEDGNYNMFLGIPYGKVDPDNPFGPSAPNPKFDSVFEANNDTARCPQIQNRINEFGGNLDCLHLNIYVPKTASPNNPLPVLVWMHGGRYKTGFSGRYIYGPKYLMKHDVIVVTLNYRLGVYGFMCLDIPEVPGNQGLKDQLLAFKWIKENIGNFGGNSSKITLMGHSAGAHAVNLHLHYMKENLFDQAILQSSYNLFFEGNKTMPIILAQSLGYHTSNVYEALNFLKKVDPKEVVELVGREGYIFYPCVEKNNQDPDAYITEYPVNTGVPNVKNIPLLLGFTNDEWLSHHYGQDDEYFQNLYIIEEKVKEHFECNDEEFNEMETRIRRFYFGDEEYSAQNADKTIDFESDMDFVYGGTQNIKKYNQYDAKKIYFYLFSYDGDHNHLREYYNITTPGKATHGDEISYLFDVSYMTEPNTADQLIVDRMTTMWTNFVKFGDPTPEISDLLPVKWIPLTKDNYTYLEIKSEMSLGSRPFHERMEFMDLFYDFYKKNRKFLKKLYL